MPGKHAEGTKLIGLYAERGLVEKIDYARIPNSRSDFFRDALVDHLQKQGVNVPDEYRRARDRAGKGGPTKHKIGSKPDAEPKSDDHSLTTPQPPTTPVSYRARKKKKKG